MTVRYTHLAEADLQAIGDYTLRTWGEAQAERYLLNIEARCAQIGTAPERGRACDHIRPGLRSIASGKHIIFYFFGVEGVLVSRILHQRVLPERHVFAGEETE